MISDSRYIYIEGLNSGQMPIRPHNWAERFAGSLATYSADRRLRYSSTLEPLSINGTKWLRICRTLQDSNPALVRDMLAFAEHYHLRIHGLVRHSEMAELQAACDPLAKAS